MRTVERKNLRVALFATCLTDLFYPRTGQAVVRLLERLGCAVDFPLEQTCCGQMHYNTGYADQAAPLADAYERLFRDYDAVVMPSGSCAGMVREVHPKLCGANHTGTGHTGTGHTGTAHAGAGPTGTGRDRPELPADRTYELSEFLVDVLGVEDVGAYFPHRVTYHPTCHSLRMLGVGDKPLRLLRAVRGLDLVELPAADSCCGFGGTFAIKNAETSTAMLADKMRGVLDTGAEVLTAGDNSCLMHIGGGLSRLRSGVRTVHLAEILASTEEEPWPARTR
ncbi:(Fe-S)-binding protein [Goodfellowiella coeruleoviolacea]|uniref:L-lactate dehydrogenase complex protein LldE n=1 Tax=Goodfellowiella coeruleoviolacea TaxID=334858 RepID=A0AAE3KLL7_9PSEU|nr:(Fe-S)-binding protein [Goodfellowiella coeruleoviolacea]MCP2170449.1 L-lactate dehydrogenase complex protein LldE [Goodfellowiella coeruleoviolacea]